MKKGFVLLELVLVLIIFGLSLILIFPSLSRFSKTAELKSTAQKIAALLRNSRSEAIHKGRIYQIMLLPDMRKIQVIWREPDSESVEGEEKTEEAPPRVFTLPEWVSLEEIELKPPQYLSGLSGIEFYPNGGSNGGSFLIKGEAHSGYRIKIHLITGMVEVEKVI